MARSRNIKPAFFKNEDLAELPFQDRLLFIGLWGLADREGRLENRVKRIKAEVFPYDDVDVEQGLNNLVQMKFIVIYKVHDSSYIQISNWDKHQNPHHKEVESVIPEVNQGTIIQESSMGYAKVMQIVPCPTDSLNLIPDTLNPILDDWEKDFNIFWHEYPRKEGKKEAKAVWKKTRPNLQDVLNTLSWQKQSKRWFEQGGAFIPMGSTYMQNQRYLDERPELVTF
jgi:hypothetical protein